MVCELFDQSVVLGVEHLVDGAQCDVLVATAVTADEVDVEQLVVVVARGDDVEAVAGDEVVVGKAVGRGRRCAVGDVVEERRADVQHVGRRRHGSREVALDEAGLRSPTAAVPFGPGRKLPYGSTAIIGMSLTSASTSCRPSLVAAWSLIIAQVARPPSSDDRNMPVATGPLGDRCVLTQEELVRGVRGVRLALIDERRVGVDRVAEAVGARARSCRGSGS